MKTKYGAKWRKARKEYLFNNGLCAICAKAGKYVSANVVDHIIPHKGNDKLFWNKRNWQPLCTTCHNRKTAGQDGGFGNKRKDKIKTAACDENGYPIDDDHHWRKLPKNV